MHHVGRASTVLTMPANHFIQLLAYTIVYYAAFPSEILPVHFQFYVCPNVLTCYGGDVLNDGQTCRPVD